MKKKEFETHRWGVNTRIYLKDDVNKTQQKISAVDFEQYLIEYIVDTGYRNVMFSECELVI